jgi:tetratricopeptide (TPR) repeat protein
VDALRGFQVIDADGRRRFDERMEATAALRGLRPTTEPARKTSEHDATHAVLRRAKRFIKGHRYTEAVDALGAINVAAGSAPELALDVLLCEGWARMYLGELGKAESTLERARSLAESPSFTDLDRAEALFRLGSCRFKLGRVSNAISLFSAALGLTGTAGEHQDLLRARIFDWRSRCYQVQRDWEAAKADAEHALELAESLGDDLLIAHALMQCSLVAERLHDPLLGRFYAERARMLAIAAGDRQTEARLLNNLGGLSFLLGEAEKAFAYLRESFAIALDIGNYGDAAQAVSSLAQVHLRCGAPILAEEQARYALSILGEREDHLDERGNTHLVLGRALLGQDREHDAMREFAAAEWLFARLDSASHIAAAWLAQGDTYKRLGDLESASELYRRAAEKLQDFNF